MKVKIYQPSKSAMQSGRGNSAKWVLEYELATPRRTEPLMGWTASNDTLNQVRMKFASKDAAVAFAESEGWEYDVEEAQERKVKPQNYVDNFKYRPADDEA